MGITRAGSCTENHLARLKNTSGKSAGRVTNRSSIFTKTTAPDRGRQRFFDFYEDDYPLTGQAIGALRLSSGTGRTAGLSLRTAGMNPP